MTRSEIPARLLAKECLRRAFLAAGVRWWDSPVPPDSHGEFGTYSAWLQDPQIRLNVGRWTQNAPDVHQIVTALLEGVNLSAADMEQATRSDLLARIDACLANQEITGSGIAERLAEGAILPMYGFPFPMARLARARPKSQNNPYRWMRLFWRDCGHGTRSAGIQSRGTGSSPVITTSAKLRFGRTACEPRSCSRQLVESVSVKGSAGISSGAPTVRCWPQPAMM